MLSTSTPFHRSSAAREAIWPLVCASYGAKDDYHRDLLGLSQYTLIPETMAVSPWRTDMSPAGSDRNLMSIKCGSYLMTPPRQGVPHIDVPSISLPLS